MKHTIRETGYGYRIKLNQTSANEKREFETLRLKLP